LRAAQEIQNKPPGLVDTLNAGFVALNKRLWIVALPVLLDLLLWRGPHVTPLPLGQRFLAWYQDALGAGGGDLLAPSGQRVDELVQMAEAALASFNMLTLLILNIASVPTTTAGRPGDTSLVFEINSEASFAVLVVLLLLLGVLLGSIYFGLVAQQVRDGTVSPRRLAAKVGPYLASLVSLMLILFLGAVLLSVPLVLLATFGMLLGGVMAQIAIGIIGSVIYFVGVWAFLLLFFSVDAVVVSEVGAPRAILNSVLVVGRNFWSSLGFIALIFVIISGMQVIWSNLSYSTWGVVAGILGNAYIASGLVASTMLFYQSRLVKLEENGSIKRFFLRRR
jgi:hypothetical protein